jgi:RNA polymerase sigma-70 factor, ECF subfamily
MGSSVPVNQTPVSLLDRLKVAKPDAAEWRRLQDIYQPLIRAWLARVPALCDEAHDLTQEVFLVVIRELPRFERLREGSFRTWLRRVTVNRVRTFSRGRGRQPATGQADGAEGFLSQLEDPASNLAKEWDRQHDEHVFQKVLSCIESDVSPSTWEAFRRSAVEGQSTAQVAAALGISENAVLIAKFRVLKRLRAEAAGLVD